MSLDHDKSTRVSSKDGSRCCIPILRMISPRRDPGKQGRRLPTEDAIIDFSNPEAVAWYQAFLARLLRMGVGVWARSAWAGSQRYPLHWGDDTENTDSAMVATLRAGLSLGLCGFTFWSHDIDGFVKRAPEELYRRGCPSAC